MKTLLTTVCLSGAFAFNSTCLWAQWPSYAKPQVPKTAAGQVDLNAPAPKTSDGKPDLSGVWENPSWSAAALARAPGADAPPSAGKTGSVDTSSRKLFADIGAGVPGGLPIQPWAAELAKKRQANDSRENPDARCLPMGIMQFHNHPQPRKIVQTADLIVIMYEANYGLRQIFTDGRSLPGPDVDPWWYGYSVGKWDGDTLVVETTHFADGGWLDIKGDPLTDAAKITERFRRPNFGNLEIEVTVDDPKAYTKPWTVTVKQQLMVNEQLIEAICIDLDAAHYVDPK